MCGSGARMLHIPPAAAFVAVAGGFDADYAAVAYRGIIFNPADRKRRRIPSGPQFGKLESGAKA